MSDTVATILEEYLEARVISKDLFIKILKLNRDERYRMYKQLQKALALCIRIEKNKFNSAYSSEIKEFIDQKNLKINFQSI